MRLSRAPVRPVSSRSPQPSEDTGRVAPPSLPSGLLFEFLAFLPTLPGPLRHCQSALMPVSSSSDAAWVKRWYPPLAESSPIGVMELERLNASSGQQRDFSFQPDSTRDYTIQVIGAADCKIVLFEVRDEEPRHFLSADDSGSEANVKIKSKFIKGRTYIIRVRVNYTSTPDAVGLLIS